MAKIFQWLCGAIRRRLCFPVHAAFLPHARFTRPEAWTETDKTNLAVFLATPSGVKFVHTLHSLVTDRALAVCERTQYENGMTGGMSMLLGEIERLSVEGEPETIETENDHE